MTGTRWISANNEDKPAEAFSPGVHTEGAPLRGGALVLTAQAFKLVLQVFGMVMLSRLLTPEDFGLVAMVGAVTGFVGLFADLGLPHVIVQRTRITQDQVSTLFWINLAFSLLLTFVVILCAPLIALAYGDPRLTGIAHLNAALFLVYGATAQYRALLLRQSRLRVLMFIDILALALSVLAAVTMAWSGFGPWSLVAMPIIQACLQLYGSVIASGWRPGLPTRACGVAPMLRFGGSLLGVTAFGYLSRQVDKVGLGMLYGAGPLGYYSRGYQIFMLPISQVATPLHDVMVPTLSRLTTDPGQFLATFRRALSALGWVSAAGAAAAMLWSQQIVNLIFGSGWDPVAAILRNLAPAMFLQPLITAAGWVFVSRGEGERYRRWALGTALIQGLALLFGLPFGVNAVAMSISVCTWMLTLPWTLRCLQQSSVDLKRSTERAIGIPFAVAAAALVLALSAGKTP